VTGERWWERGDRKNVVGEGKRVRGN
jgi:hypothetical protein